MRVVLVTLFISIVFTACQKTAVPDASATAKRYPFHGTVISVDRATKKAKFDHEEVPGFMDAMTMDFPIKDDWVWDELKPGADVRAELVVDNANNAYWLEKIAISTLPGPGQTAPPLNDNFAQIGKDVPDFTLTNQDGKPVSIKSFHGKALAITFIYRKCPLPDYCIKMSKNFSDLANQLKDDEQAKDKIRLLSISFDPEQDTPAKLREYGIGYLGNDPNANFNIWQLAVGTDKQVRSIAEFFGLRYEVDPNDKTQINHSLRTAVISPEGKVTKIYAGNDWTPAELLHELQSTLK